MFLFSTLSFDFVSAKVSNKDVEHILSTDGSNPYIKLQLESSFHFF